MAAFACTSLQTNKTHRSPGTYIPELGNYHFGEFTGTRWVSAANGTYLEVHASQEEAWNALVQAFGNLGVKSLGKVTAAHEWQTDWVVWKYDNKTGKAGSKPGFGLGGQKLERHRFLFTVTPGVSPDSARIVAVDTLRQREVDIAPDSQYSWLEWKKRSPQQQAADTFLRRLQLPIESALATEFVVSEETNRATGSDPVTADNVADTRPDVVLTTIPEVEMVAAVPRQAQELPQAEIDKPASGIVTVASDEATRQPEPVQAAVGKSPPPVKAVREPATAGKKLPDKLPHSKPQPLDKPIQQPGPVGTGVTKSRQDVQSPQQTVITQPQATSSEVPGVSRVHEQPVTEETATVPAGSPLAAAITQPENPGHPHKVIQPETPAAPAANGLLIRAAPELAWPALLQSLENLGIGIESFDERQHLLTTGWVNANYDGKNQLLIMQSNGKPKWAFNLFGNKGIERHRFQLVMVPANRGTRSIVYAYHTWAQEQVDQTPDSSQTLLVWEDRDTSTDVALAFLRRLRIVIPQ